MLKVCILLVLITYCSESHVRRQIETRVLLHHQHFAVSDTGICEASTVYQVCCRVWIIHA